MMESFSG